MPTSTPVPFRVMPDGDLGRFRIAPYPTARGFRAIVYGPSGWTIYRTTRTLATAADALADATARVQYERPAARIAHLTAPPRPYGI